MATMTTVEDKVDMSLDDIIAKRQTEQREKRVPKKPLKFSPGKKDTPMTDAPKTRSGGPRRRSARNKVSSGEVAVESGKLKRAAKVAARRGLGGGAAKESDAEIAKKATANVKAKKMQQKKATTVVNLAGKKVAAAAKKQPVKKPVMELPASSEERAVKVKDFTLPKDTKMVITFEPSKTKTKTAPKKQVPTGTAARRKNAAASSKNARAAKMNENRMDVDTPSRGTRRRPRGAAGK